MKKGLIIGLLMTGFFYTSCEKEEEKLPDIEFKKGGNYTSSDVILPGGTVVLIGIDAHKTEKRDVLKKFDISQSINGGASTSVYSKDLTSAEEDDFSYDYSTVMDTVSGKKTKYVLSVTNRDGLTNDVSLTLTVQ